MDDLPRLRAEHFEKGPLLLVTHGGTAKALISALLHDEAFAIAWQMPLLKHCSAGHSSACTSMARKDVISDR